MPVHYFVLCQPWEESERGWGTRPDGYSLHHSLTDLRAFIAAHWATLPDGYVPAEYSRPYLDPYLCEVDEDTYNAVKASGHGVRKYDARPERAGWTEA